MYHAAYGTAGFDAAMVSLSMRQQISGGIGAEAEELVYLHYSCDREFIFARIDKDVIRFRDRFTNEKFDLTGNQAKDFCELTVAKERERAIASEDFRLEHGEGLKNLFEEMPPG